MESQDNKFSNNITLAALAAIILGILIAFYYSYAQSKNQINFLQEEKAILVKDLTLMKADVDRLEARNMVDEIEIQKSKQSVERLLDSVGRLNFTIEKLREFKSELRKLEARNDSLKLKNNLLKYTNTVLVDKYEKTQKEIQVLRAKSSSLAEAESLQRRKMKELNEELKVKKYLVIDNSRGNGARVKGGKRIQTNKASVVEKLDGCAVVGKDMSAAGSEKIIYFQFLGPTMQIIEDNANTITVNGNVYSKRVEFNFDGNQREVCSSISLPSGSLEKGTYTINIFEDERLLSSSEFQLK
ncbi:hypothetical protein FGM00_19220 [Aggregatimonas sangjinii]|uniref:Chromosome partitioning protein ParA n=1 Tax=Aggregatimonas sangjinii TaxID=2583587 RepID=A0A5B7SVD0_9FLAO|nr:hypothetical protein [Aggregatimonas sangjinii]QCX02142.1 hypothetical protein FGM00_19220 [Aggregatimonas sangjinii]